MKPKNKVLDKAIVKLPLPSKVLVISDIHLAAKATPASKNVELEISKRLVELMAQDSAAIILNGDIFELWAGKDPSPARALKAHPRFTAALRNFSKSPNHQVIFVAGNHDGKLGWSDVEQTVLEREFSCTMCLSAEVHISTSKGQRKILFEHGHMLDPDNAFEDQRDPHDKPFGQYIVQVALPMVKQTQGKLFDGIEFLAEPHKFAKFVSSRVLYREIFSRLWWLLVPLAVTLGLRLIFGYGLFSIGKVPLADVEKIMLYTELAIVLNVVAVLIAGYLILSKLLSRAKAMPQLGGGPDHNGKARSRAQELCAKGDYLGFVSGHTHRSEISQLEPGFYANTGCGTEMVESAKTFFALPKTYVSRNHLSWLEFDLQPQACKIDLWQSIEDNHKQTRLEKLATKNKDQSEPLRIKKSAEISY